MAAIAKSSCARRVRRYQLNPYPFAQPELSFQFPARQVKGKIFRSSAHWQTEFHGAPVEMLSVTVRANGPPLAAGARKQKIRRREHGGR